MSRVTGKIGWALPQTRRVGFLCLVSIAVFSLFHLLGCTADSPKAAPKTTAEVPAGPGDALLAVAETTKPDIGLKRADSTFEIKAQEGFKLYSDDLVANKSPADFRLKGLKDDVSFLVRANAKIQVGENSLLLVDGTTRMKFRKINGVYKVKLPGATLGIRGTELEVTVASDSSSAITIMEGIVEMERGTEKSELKAGDRVILGPNGSSAKLNPPDEEVPAFLKGLSNGAMGEALQKF